MAYTECEVGKDEPALLPVYLENHAEVAGWRWQIHLHAPWESRAVVAFCVARMKSVNGTALSFVDFSRMSRN